MILINPKSTKFGIFERYVPLSVPIGIGYLAGSLISHNKDARVIDEHIAPISKEILERSLVDLKKPHVFGISSLTACINRSYEISGLKFGYDPGRVVGRVVACDDDFVSIGRIFHCLNRIKAPPDGRLRVVRGNNNGVAQCHLSPRLVRLIKRIAAFNRINGI